MFVLLGMSRHHSRAAVDPAKPKSKMTAYAFFVQTCREEHKRKYPEEIVDFGEFSKKTADRWKTMTEQEKRRFHQMSEADRRRYELEMASYVPPAWMTAAAGNGSGGGRAGGPPPAAGRARKKKKAKDPNAPRRSMSAFFHFSALERGKVKAANPDFQLGDIAKEMSRRWSDASPEVRQKYDALADKDKERYEREKQAYQAKLEAEKLKLSYPVAVDEEGDSDEMSD